MQRQETRYTNDPADSSTNIQEPTQPKSSDVPQETTQSAESAESYNVSDEFAQSYIINILFLGIDRDEDRDETLGIFRTDTISLVSINLDTKKVDVLCIPRDTYTYLPIKDKNDKINHAYAFGSLKGHGVESTIEAVNHFIKYTKVDYYFTIDMEPIAEIVDTLGGVKLDVDVDIGDDIKKGVQLLNGEQALKYARWRYSGNGDIDRIKRQQKLLKAMYDKLKDDGQLINAVKIVLSYNKSVKTNMSLKQLLALAMLASDIPSDSINTLLVPGTGKIINKIWYWVPDEEITEEMLKEVFVEVIDN